MTPLSSVRIVPRYFTTLNGVRKMTNWFDEHLIVTGLSESQNEALREAIIGEVIEKITEGENKDA
jgi:ribosomal silencing factor RsfS